MQDRLDAAHPNRFKYDFIPDHGTTGRLEVAIQRGEKTVQVHSKASGAGYPKDDWAGFDARLNAALQQLA